VQVNSSNIDILVVETISNICTHSRKCMKCSKKNKPHNTEFIFPYWRKKNKLCTSAASTAKKTDPISLVQTLLQINKC